MFPGQAGVECRIGLCRSQAHRWEGRRAGPGSGPTTIWLKSTAAPVIIPESSDARNATALATSWVLRSRPNGWLCSAFSNHCGSPPWKRYRIMCSAGLSIQPMLNAFTRMRSQATEWATLRVSTTSAPLLVA